MDILEILKEAKDDPFWAEHSEVSKNNLGRAIDEIERLRTELSELRAKAEAQQAVSLTTLTPIVSSVPNGWKLVRTPITEDMHAAAAKVLLRATGLDGTPQRMLDAMLGAAPSPAGLGNPVTMCPVCEEVPMADGNACGRCGGYAPEAPKS